MLNLGKFSAKLQYCTLLHSPISHNLQFPSKPLHTRYNCHAVPGKLRSGLCCSALKTKKNGDIGLAEMDGPDEFEEEFLDVEIEGDDYDEDEVVVPLQNTKKWLENKPRGFGEGKVYDTSIEDKLMEEIEQSRKAQLANVNKLKNSSVKPSSNKETSKQNTGLTHIQDGFPVRLVNLPKKKNIHRDLKLAFKEVPGILNIVPVVSGNEKTRDPVCKGLAFVHFKSHYEAQRFVQNFSGKSISFGKAQKQIKCEMSNSKLPKPPRDQDESNHSPQKPMYNLDKDSDTSIETDVSVLHSWDESSPSELDDDDDTDKTLASEQRQNHLKINETSTTSNSNLSEERELRKESAIDSSSSKQEGKLKTKKKVSSKSKKDKIPKLNVPGSAKRLKIREKEMLTGVFSKYAANATLTLEEQSR